jgi:hypothetical protein
MLRPDGVKEKRYCGFHDRNSHSINDCRVFRMRIQKAIQERHLKFDNKMKLDGHPFPQNMIGFSVNMVTAEEKGKVKVLTSARAKQGGAVDPARQVTLEQVHREAPRVLKSHVEVGNHPGPSPESPRASSSTNGSVSRRKSATKGEDTKRRGAGLRKKRAGKNWSSTHGNKSVHIGGAHSSDTAGMRV